MEIKEPTGWAKILAVSAVSVFLTLGTVLVSTGTYREKIENTEKQVTELHQKDQEHERELKQLRDLTVETVALQRQQAEMNKLMLQHIIREASNVRTR